LRRRCKETGPIQKGGIVVRGLGNKAQIKEQQDHHELLTR
jgi:hypothetical protein